MGCMHSHTVGTSVLAPCSLVFGTAGAALAADLAPPEALVTVAPGPVLPGWSFRFVPYGWITSLDGTQTVRGRSVKVDASFADIVEASDTLAALMGTVEARYGPVGLYADVVWSRIGFERNNLRTRTPAPGDSAAIGRSLGLEAVSGSAATSPGRRWAATASISVSETTSPSQA
jgi:hypothetical protein